jgi:predicted  nucleic acid-binding Zn-ribbon protein
MMALAVAMCALHGPAHAEGNRDQEQIRRLRMQLREVQQQQEATVQEARTKAEADKAALAQSMKAVQGEAAAQRAAASTASRRVKAMSDEIAALQKDKAQLQEDLVKAKQALEEAQTKSTAQQGQASQTIAGLEQRHVQTSSALDQCRHDNAGLYQLGSELLDKYERKGLGEVFSANEPFLGLARVKLENAKAAYQDKLDALKHKPDTTSAAAP